MSIMRKNVTDFQELIALWTGFNVFKPKRSEGRGSNHGRDACECHTYVVL